jgi:hypothetical protein
MSDEDEQLVRSLFLVGGYSSNSQKSSRDESRRIELRISSSSSMSRGRIPSQ